MGWWLPSPTQSSCPVPALLASTWWTVYNGPEVSEISSSCLGHSEVLLYSGKVAHTWPLAMY